MRFIQDHPYVVLGALAAVVAIPLLGPRRIARTSLVGGVLMIGLGGTLAVSGAPGVKL